ncbi:hypothetical protein Tco_0453814 [Tanacetum coccineum]
MGSIWGGGTSGVIVYGYDGFPIHPVPQDEDEREPRFVEVHDTDFVPEHAFPAEEQPLPPVDSPTAESVLTNPKVQVKMEMEIPRTSKVNSQPHAYNSHFIFLIKDIMIAERLTTQLPLL